MSQNQELIDYYKNLLIIQYGDKQKAIDMMNVIITQAMIYDIAIAVRDGFAIENAQGKQLDVLAKFEGVDRVITGTSFSRDYFGFCEYGDTEPFGFTGYLRYGEPAPDVQFRDYEESETSLFSLTDEELRVIIKLAIIRNNSNGSVYDIDQILDTLFGTDVYFNDRQDMTVVSYLVGTRYGRIFSIARSSGLLPNPAGVGTTLSVVNDINNIFAYSLYGGNAPDFAVGYRNYYYTPDFVAMDSPIDAWQDITTDKFGNRWAVPATGKIYKCMQGENTFVVTDSPTLAYSGIKADKDGNIWAASSSGIYKANVGSVVFTKILTADYSFTCIETDKDGNIWAGRGSNKIYKCNYGTTNFMPASSVDRIWNTLHADKDGNIWAGTGFTNDVIYMCVYESTTFSETTSLSGFYYQIDSDSDGNIYAVANGQKTQKCLSGSTVFIEIGTARAWRGITIDKRDDIYATVGADGIYKSISGADVFSPVTSDGFAWGRITADIDGNIYPVVNPGKIYKGDVSIGNLGCMASYA